MAGIRKHGSHRISLSSGNIAAANALPAALWIYDGYAGPQTVASASGGVDSTTEKVTEMALVLSTALTGQAGSFTTFLVTHANSAGTTKNQLSVAASAAAFVFGANAPADLAVGNGATIPGGGTGTLSVAAGVALPWTLVNGDVISFSATQTGAGQYVGGAGITFLVAAGA